ncbi:hypothetical protein FV218_15520 [Methylobacterium sp. WL69]|nr:hypothetical protein FV218_15520 [Methylobacterium sp. WL69]
MTRCHAGPLLPRRGSPLLEGEGQGEVCGVSGQSTTLTPTLSQTGEGARRGYSIRIDQPELVSVMRRQPVAGVKPRNRR